MNWRAVRGRFRSRRARGVAQVCVIVLLLVVAWQVYGLRTEAATSESQIAAVNSILAESCGAATFAELREEGLVEECRLARAGELADAIPQEELPAPDEDPAEMPADVIDDDATSTPADVAPPSSIDAVTDAEVVEAVATYLDGNPLDTAPGYERAIRRAVATYLTANPPADGRPPSAAEVRDAVRAIYLANPPADGSDGSDGAIGATGATGAAGPPGADPTPEQIASAVAAYCTANGQCRGPEGDVGPAGVVETSDNCTPAEGEYVADVNISGPAGTPLTITVSCTTATLPVLPGLTD